MFHVEPFLFKMEEERFWSYKSGQKYGFHPNRQFSLFNRFQTQTCYRIINFSPFLTVLENKLIFYYQNLIPHQEKLDGSSDEFSSSSFSF